MRRWMTMAGTMILALGLSVSGCGSAAAEGDTVAVQSVSMLAGLGSVGLQNKYAGVVVAQATHEITKDDERKIGELKVAVGDEVTAGQLLFTYDIDDIKLSVETAELELEKMENTLESTKKQITQLEKEKKKAKSSEQLSYSIEIQTLQADVKEQEYTLKTKTAELERLKATMGNTEVVSEVNGTVQSIKEDNSSSDYSYEDYGGSGESQAFITIVETGSYRVKGTVNEMNVSDIGSMEGSPVIIRSRVDAAQTWSGTMGAVDTENTASNNQNQYYYYYGNSDENTTSSKYNFYVDLDDSEGLMMGQHVYIELNQGQDDAVEGISIASYFIDQQENGNYVWAATAKDKLEKRKVELGEYNEELDTWIVTEGLSADDYIAIPSEELKEGLPVTRYDEAYFDQGDIDYGDGEFSEGEYSEGEYSEGEYSEGEYADGEMIEEEMGEEEMGEEEMLDEGDFGEEAEDDAEEMIEEESEEQG